MHKYIYLFITFFLLNIILIIGFFLSLNNSMLGLLSISIVILVLIFSFYNSSLIKKSQHLALLGPEPLEKSWNFLYLKKYLFGRKRSIKNILMDQKCVSGLGNIYVNEILFLSKIKPIRPATKLKNFEIEKIIKFSKKILKNSIKLGGSTIKDFSSENGKKGDFQQHFKVYGRENQDCSNIDCNLRIIKTVISNRATFFCKKCQK